MNRNDRPTKTKATDDSDYFKHMAEQLLDSAPDKPQEEPAGRIEVAEDLDPSKTVIDWFKDLVKRRLKRE
jgi:hypothetical protein